MADSATRLATYQDVLDAPANLVAEIVAGVLHTSPRPAGPHTNAASVLTGDLNGPYQRGRGGPGGWWIFVEPELHLGDDVLVPDLAGWTRERMPSCPETAYFELAPDWVCEVISPGRALYERAQKLPRYASHGVHWAWLVDPNERTVDVFENVAGHWTLRRTVGDEDGVALPPFEDVQIDLPGMWEF